MSKNCVNFILLICCLWGRYSPLFGQQQHYLFESFPAVDANIQSTVTQIIQDRNGFIWLGTWMGLARFDGNETRIFTESAGLGNRNISALFEDKKGNIWVGVRNAGLYRYNEALENFEPAADFLGARNALPAINISCLFEAQNGRFWIGSEQGLFYFDDASKAFQVVQLKGETPAPSPLQYLYQIFQTADSRLWIASSHGLFCAQESSAQPAFHQIPLHTHQAGLSSHSLEAQNFSYCLYVANNHPEYLWVGTKSGLKRIRLSSLYTACPEIISLEHQSSNPASLSHNFVSSICESNFPEPNSLWVGTYDGLNLLKTEGNSLQFERFFADSQYPGGLKGSIIRSLWLDRTGILWIGTNKGLNKLDPHAVDFKTLASRELNKSIQNPVSSLAVTQQNLWFGSFGSGINRTPLHQGKPHWEATAHYMLADRMNSPVSGFISSVLADNRGNIWVATQGAGAFCFAEKDIPPGGGLIKSARQFSKCSPATQQMDDYLMCAVATENGNMWFGGWDNGLYCYNHQTETTVHFTLSEDGKTDFRHYPIFALLEGKPEDFGGKTGLIWVATKGGGLFLIQFNPEKQSLSLVNQWTAEGAANQKLCNNFTTSLYRAADGRVCVTSESGIDCWAGARQQMEHIQLKGRLTNPVIQAMTEDHLGRIWISTQNGIASVDPAQEWKLTNYNHQNGQKERFFNNNAVVRLSDQSILFGGNNGITHFNPGKIQPDSIAPNTMLVGLRLFNHPVTIGAPTKHGFLLEQSLATLPRLTLSHRENVVSFEFSSLQFSNPEQHVFAYKLEGFDENWTCTFPGQRIAHYTNLPPGNYVFWVKSANSDGAWDQTPARLAITVNPPWWKSTWAWMVYWMLAAAAIYGAFRILLIRANYRHQLELERLEKSQLEEVDRIKSSFFTNISHELKTPLTLIISPLEELIRRRGEAADNLPATLVGMHRNAMRLYNMIIQLLDLRKAEAGLMKLEVLEGNLAVFVQDIFMSFQLLTTQKEVHFEFKTSSPKVTAWFDPDYLEKVVFNLCSNAVKFTAPGGSIQLEVGESAENQRVFIRISDTGKGIAHEKLPNIFDQFYQAEEQHGSGMESGSGIGLSLVKSIVELHQGTIEVSSELGKGATFTVWLKAGADHFDPSQKKNQAPSLVQMDEALLPPVEESANEVLSTASTQEKCHILVVDDNLEIRSYLVAQLSGQYEVTAAPDGQAALEQALDNPPDLILCDIAMPGLDGLELTRQLKSRMETSHIPVILVTAHTSLNYKIDGLEAGADDFVTKPFNMHLLTIRIKNLIETRIKLREKYAQSLRQVIKTDVAAAGNGLDDQFLQQIYQVIEANLETPDFSVNELAQKIHMNRKQIYRKVKALTDQTPNELIRVVRLRRAAELLKSGQFTVSEVTYKVGFQDLKYFRERFRDFFGVTPSEY